MEIQKTSISTSLCNAWFSIYEKGKLIAEIQWDLVTNKKIFSKFHVTLSSEDRKKVYSSIFAIQ